VVEAVRAGALARFAASIVMAAVGAAEVGCSTSSEEAAPRTLVHRALRATPVDDLLIDPFVTGDDAWGHFILVDPAGEDSAASNLCEPLAREVLSASPGGVAGASILVNPVTNPANQGCSALLASVIGSAAPVSAQIWISLDDSEGNPTGLDPAALDQVVAVSLIANPLPGATAGAPESYPLAVSEPLLTVGGRTWAHLTTRGTATLPQGGFFSVTFVSSEPSLHLGSPGVAPVATGGLKAIPRVATDGERAATMVYTRTLGDRPHRERRPVTRSVR
jgi:hypothetical protein